MARRGTASNRSRSVKASIDRLAGRGEKEERACHKHGGLGNKIDLVAGPPPPARARRRPSLVGRCLLFFALPKLWSS